MTSLLVAMLVFCSLLAASTGQGTRSVAPPALPAISMFAGGNFGPGWWTLDIDDEGSFSAYPDGSGRRRRLTEPQREALFAVLSALPRDRATYSFVGPSYIDITVAFRLMIGKGAFQQRYVVNETFADYGSHPEVKQVLRVMHFLRTLLDSKEAHVPPPIDAPAPK
jgi:hypothetical protein